MSTPPAPCDEPLVPVAFALGWHVAELYRPRLPVLGAQTAVVQRGVGAAARTAVVQRGVGAAARTAAPGTSDAVAGAPEQQPADDSRGGDLPGVSRLTDAQLNTLRLSQIKVDLAALQGRIDVAGVAAPTLAPDAQLTGGGEGARQAQVLALHTALLTALTAVDFRLGKAYGLGRALADTTREPTDGASLACELDGRRIANLRGWTSDLTSTLPPHAGHAVAASLGYWAVWAQAALPYDVAELDQAVHALRRQGELWRSVLSGERHATDVLAIQDFVDAAGDAMRRTSTICIRFLARFWWLTLIVLALAGGGVALILVADKAANILAGVGALLASFGITWRSLQTGLGNVLRKLEVPMWEAEVDESVTYAITLAPARDQIPRVPGVLSRRLARRAGRRAAASARSTAAGPATPLPTVPATVAIAVTPPTDAIATTPIAPPEPAAATGATVSLAAADPLAVADPPTAASPPEPQPAPPKP